METDCSNNKFDLAIYRLNRAKEEYLAAIDTLKLGYYKVANNRAYYSIFHSMRAILALDAVDFKKHSEIIAYFRQNYIKTGLFEQKFSDIIGNASEIRTASDYDDFYIATKEEAQTLLLNAIEFYNTVEEYISRIIGRIL